MAQISMKTPRNLSLETAFKDFIAACEVRGVKDRTLRTYQQHFRSISKKPDVSISPDLLWPPALDATISEVRRSQLSDQSIISYTRTLKAFLSWCNENISICKASEDVKKYIRMNIPAFLTLYK